MLASDETLSESHVQKAEQIVEMAQQLQEKSDTARTYSRLLQEDTEFSLHNLSDIINESTQTISGEYPNVGFDIDIPEACTIRAPAGIRNAIEELIENAAEHADPVSPHVNVQLHNSNGARLMIADNGSGMSEMELETLEQGEETSLSHSQGIGLWMSKWLIERADGQLSFEQFDPGTRVIVEFPSPKRINSKELDIPTLKERDQRLQTVIDRMTNGILEVNAAWDITFVDSRAEEILEVTADEIQGKQFWDVFSNARDTQFEAAYRDAMRDRTSQHVEAYYSGIDGWLSVYVYPEFDGGLSFYFQETTERNRREQELQQAQSRMELALRVTDSTVWEWDVETDSVTTHPESHTAFGTNITTGREFLDAIHPDDRAQVQEALETAIEEETPYSVEYRVQHEDGIRWVEDYGEVHQDWTDGSKRLIGVARDCTQEKERIRRYEAIFNQTYQFTGLIKPDGTLIEANDTALEFGGISREDVIGKKIWNAHWFEISEETQNQTKRDVQRAAEGEFVRRELEVQGADDTVIIDFSVRPITDDTGNVVLLVPEGRDITDLKEREAQLERTHELLEHTAGIADVGSWDAVEDALETGESFDVDARIQRPDDEIRWLRLQGVPTVKDGDVVTLRGAVQDITERKEHERELQNVQAQLEDAIEAGAVGTWDWHIQKDQMVVGREFARTFGVDPKKAKQGVELDRFVSRIHEDDRDRVEEQIETAIAACGDYEAEYRVRDADEELRWVLARGYVECDEEGTALRFPGILIDITDRKQMEQEMLRHNERLTEFAGVVSHDLRNPLNAVKGRLKLAQEDYDSEHFDSMADAVERMERIIEDMLWLAREGQDIGSTESVDLVEAMKTAWTMAVDHYENAELVVSGAETDCIGTIEADADRLCQLLENLFRNAISHAGTDVSVLVGELDNGFYVEDNGPGIPDGEREEVFEFGFSTSNDGTGFGLGIAKRIAEAHGWNIRVTDGSNGGARIEITGVE